jgi:hypothetical protein
MAKVIEFYIPTNIRKKPVKWAAQPQPGRLIEFSSQTRKSA